MSSFDKSSLFSSDASSNVILHSITKDESSLPSNSRKTSVYPEYTHPSKDSKFQGISNSQSESELSANLTEGIRWLEALQDSH
ncbi:hypothetical protein K435DRAFT_863849 [Dendrothele bispora CBS 962.96]|uniref:Uncharacterized protein n=1 Tax=Dendrothele bispora (strain CBS 962.96) TaxID=1314807 RepID=A0A4V4HEG6_DENBC|nr:hypothetical protein K435DRAFT_863849 [Dendrothele bispora CBS 962.96]